jgi:hypothetical protein
MIFLSTESHASMKMTKSMHRMTVWIACCAILLSSLAPSISHAVAAAKGVPNGWTEICTVAGAKLVKLDSGAPESTLPAPTEKSTHFEHCPFCLHHAVSLGLPPNGDFVMPVVEGTHILPSLFYQASRPPFAWAAAQPRAPPAIS